MNTAIKKAEPTDISTETALVGMLERLATNPEVSPEKMMQLLDVQERILNKRAESDYNQAMAAVQAELRRVAADAENPQTRSRYASYATLDRSVRPVYTGHGFALSFDTADSPLAEHIRVLCHVTHTGGFTKTHHIDMPADGKGAKGGDVMTKTHAAGSAMSYGMRYLLKMIFNVAVGEDDDDGNAAGKARINEEQFANLQALLEEIGREKWEAKFLKHMKAKSIEDITAEAYPDAVKALESKRGK